MCRPKEITDCVEENVWSIISHDAVENQALAGPTPGGTWRANGIHDKRDINLTATICMTIILACLTIDFLVFVQYIVFVFSLLLTFNL